jgi:hypothetical protein
MLFSAVLLASCSQSNDAENSKDGNPSKLKRAESLSDKVVSEELLTLQTEKTSSTNSDALHHNLFGRFNCDRAEFYVIENPQNDIYLQRPSSIVLYYLDGELWQTKYALTGDIASRLYKELGKCRIVGLDDKNKKIINAKEMLVRSNGRTSVNTELDNYELTWIFGEKEIRYRVEKAKDGSKFTYTEKLRTYERQYYLIEKYC